MTAVATTAPAHGRGRLLKTNPGFAISAVCLWWTLRGFHWRDFADVRLMSPVWLLGLVVFSVLGYGTRCYDRGGCCAASVRRSPPARVC